MPLREACADAAHPPHGVKHYYYHYFLVAADPNLCDQKPGP